MFTTFVINLDRDRERMGFMESQLAHAGITYMRHAAVYGKTYEPTKAEYDPELAFEKGGHTLLPGEMGCALSHAQVIERVVKERLPYTLILEDDVTLPDNFRQVVEQEIERCDGAWEYLLFDYIPVGLPFIKVWWSGIKYNFKITVGVLAKMKFVLFHVIKGLYIVPLAFFEALRETLKKHNPGPVRFFRPVYFAGAYLVTLSGAEKLYELSHPVLYTADQLTNEARKHKDLKFRGYCPLVVRQEKSVFGSSILDIEGKDMR